MIADELIDFDYKWSRLFSGKAGSAEVAGVTAQDMSEAWGKSIKFTSGTGVEYRDNLFFQPNEETKGLASKVQVGSVSWAVLSSSNEVWTRLKAVIC